MIKNKIIGNFFSIIFFYSSFIFSQSSHINIKLKALDFSGKELNQAEIGVPFLVKATIEGETDAKLELQGLDQFYNRSLGTSSTIQYLNGNSFIEKNYQYEVRIDKEGQYKLGPAQLHINDRIIKSEILDILVSAEKQVSTNSQDKLAFVTLKVNKDHIVIGEQIEINVRFYYSNDVNPIGIENLDIKDFSLSKFKKSNSGEEKIKEKNYTFQEWKSELVAKKTGELIIPSVKAIFEVPTEKKMEGFPFFAPNYEQKETRSNSIKIIVDSLPVSNLNVNGVGIFKNFAATVNQNEFAQGEAIVLKLEIEGKGDLENLKIPQLNLPIQLRYYDSKNYIEHSNEKSLKKKIFEFIVQGLENGEFTIESQKFTFFNTNKKNYETLKTDPIKLKVSNIITKQIKENVIDKGISEKNINDISPIYNYFSFSKSHKREIPKFLFFIIALIPLLIKAIIHLRNFLKMKNFIIKKNTKTFKIVEKQINLCKEKNDCSYLLKFFINLFTQIFQVDESVISSDFINSKLKEKGLSSEEIKQWQIFFDKLIESAYCHGDQCSTLPSFKEQEQWLKMLKEKGESEIELEKWKEFFKISYDKSQCPLLLEQAQHWLKVFKKKL